MILRYASSRSGSRFKSDHGVQAVEARLLFFSTRRAAAPLHFRAGEPRADLGGQDVLNRENLRGAILHQLHPLAAQVARSSCFAWINVALRK